MMIRTRNSLNICHLFYKAIVVMVVLDGLAGPSTLIVPPVAGASRQSQLPSVGGSNNAGSNVNRFDTFGRGSGGSGGGVETARRFRDRCGRYSLLRVLQQWENLQKRCRLGFPDNKERARYDHIGGGGSPPSPSEIDDITIGKRTDSYGTLPAHLRPRNNYQDMNGDALESCCPVIFEVIAPIYGRNRSGHMVELYKDENVQQKFYEYRCHTDYLDKPCRFVEGQNRRSSKCVQQYLDTYALVRSDTSLTGWSMEHIRVASGCACKVDRGKKASRKRKKVFSPSDARRSSFFFGEGGGGGGGGIRRSRGYQQFRSALLDY